MASFPKTKNVFKELTNELLCVKCSNLPKEKIFLPGSCLHKYCEKCIGEDFKGRACHECQLFCKNPTPDLFTTNLLCELKKFEKDLENGMLGGGGVEDKRSTIESNPILTPPALSNQSRGSGNPSVGQKNVSKVSKGTVDSNGVSKLDSKDIKEEKPKNMGRGRPRKVLEKPPVASKVASGKVDKKEGMTHIIYKTRGNTSKRIEELPVPKAEPKPSTSTAHTINGRKSIRQVNKDKGESSIIETPKRKSILSRVRDTARPTPSPNNKNPKGNASPSPSLLNLPPKKRNSYKNGMISPAGSVKSNTSFTSISNTEKNINKKNHKGETSLFVAVRLGQLEKVRELIRLGADVNARDNAGWTPLHDSISSGKVAENILPIVEELLGHGAFVNAPGGLDLDTPLHEASKQGLLSVTELLLQSSASPNVRNKIGQLPKDVAKNDEVASKIDEYMNKLFPSSESSTSSQPIDSVVLSVQLMTSLIYIVSDDKELTCNYIDKCTQSLNAKFTHEFKNNVTHMVFFGVNSKSNLVQKITMNFLSGILNGCWMLSFKWLEESLAQGKFLEPSKFIISGAESCPETALNQAHPKDFVLRRSRTTKEHGEPSLFHGFNFYFYKSTVYSEKGLDLGKGDLIRLILMGDGKTLNREPNSDAIEPLEDPLRFHAKFQPKLAFTSHIILFDKKNEPSKKYHFEHFKTLTIDWLIDSIKNFRLADPEAYYNFKEPMF